MYEYIYIYMCVCMYVWMNVDVCMHLCISCDQNILFLESIKPNVTWAWHTTITRNHLHFALVTSPISSTIRTYAHEKIGLETDCPVRTHTYVRVFNVYKKKTPLTEVEGGPSGQVRAILVNERGKSTLKFLFEHLIIQEETSFEVGTVARLVWPLKSSPHYKEREWESK